RQRAKPQKGESYGANAGGPQDPQYTSMPTEEVGEGRVSRYEIDGEGMPNELQGTPRAELFGETGALER
ncbi:MAG: hypothetical protein L6R39_007158, partial [Caloplaca ligustica]